MGLHLAVENQLLHADIQKLFHKEVVGGGHQMHIKDHIGLFPQLTNGVQTQRHTGAEMAVQNVHMEHLNTRIFQLANGMLQIAQVTDGDQGGGKNTLFGPDFVSHASASKIAATCS